MKSVTDSYKAFLKLIDAAIKLGLEVNLVKDVLDIGKSSIDGQLHIYAKAYQLVSRNSAGSGHAMMTVYTKIGAEQIKKLYDANKAKFDGSTTVIEADFDFYTAQHLKKFIALRKKENSDL